MLEYELLSDFQSEFETTEDLRLLFLAKQGYLFLKILLVLFVYESFLVCYFEVLSLALLSEISGLSLLRKFLSAS